MIYVLTYPTFGSTIGDRIAGFRRSYEPERAKLVPPHVTLVFGLRNVTPSEILSVCETAAQQMAEFTVDFSSHEIAHDPFENTHKILLQASTGARSLVQLHEHLYRGPHQTQRHPDHPYRPHMTIATQVDRSSLEQINLDEVGSLPISGEIRSLEIVEHDGNKLRQIQTIPLKKKTPPKGGVK